jgi:hypothetical protein
MFSTTVGSGYDSRPSAAWDGSRWVSASGSSIPGSLHELVVDFVQGSDTSVNSEQPITSALPGFVDSPFLAWNASGFGVAWTDARGPSSGGNGYFATFNGDGAPTSSEIQIYGGPESSGSSAMVWTGSEYGLVWEKLADNPVSSTVIFTRLDATGAPVAADRTISEATIALLGRVAWTGSQYVVAWEQDVSGSGPRVLWQVL